MQSERSSLSLSLMSRGHSSSSITSANIYRFLYLYFFFSLDLYKDQDDVIPCFFFFYLQGNFPKHHEELEFRT